VAYSPFITQDIGTDKFSDVRSIINPCNVRENQEKPKKITYSEILTYEICPKLYKLVHHYGFEIEPTELQKYGIILHKCLDRLHFLIQNSLVITEDAVNKIVENCWQKLYDDEIKDNERKTFLARKLLEYYQKAKTQIKKVLSTEESISIYTKNMLVLGRIDLIIENVNGEIELIDFKLSGKKQWQLKEVENQLKVYSYALNEKYSIDKIAIYHFFDNKKTYFSFGVNDVEKIESYLDSICQKIINEEFKEEFSNYCSKCGFNFCCNLG